MGSDRSSLTPARRTIHRSTVGLALYAAAFGMTFGAVATATGLSLAQTMTLSLVMFTGASQFAFVGVIGGGGSPFAALAPATLLGVRNAFYGVPITAIARPRGVRRLLAAHFVIDETTAIATAQSDRDNGRYAFWLTGLWLFSLWNLGTLVGALIGAAFDPRALGLDAAAPAVFLALLWPQVRDATSRMLSAGAIGVAALLIPLTPSGVPVIAAGMLAMVVGFRVRAQPRDGGAPREHAP